MIKLFRIDERLIHGQIAIKWSRHTGVDSIVVANDHAADDPEVFKDGRASGNQNRDQNPGCSHRHLK